MGSKGNVLKLTTAQKGAERMLSLRPLSETLFEAEDTTIFLWLLL